MNIISYYNKILNIKIAIEKVKIYKTYYLPNSLMNYRKSLLLRSRSNNTVHQMCYSVMDRYLLANFGYTRFWNTRVIPLNREYSKV